MFYKEFICETIVFAILCHWPSTFTVVTSWFSCFVKNNNLEQSDWKCLTNKLCRQLKYGGRRWPALSTLCFSLQPCSKCWRIRTRCSSGSTTQNSVRCFFSCRVSTTRRNTADRTSTVFRHPCRRENACHGYDWRPHGILVASCRTIFETF